MKTLLILILMTGTCFASPCGSSLGLGESCDMNMLIDVSSTLPPTDCVELGNNGEICGLSSGKLKFAGNVDKSAKIFFDYFIKHYSCQCKDSK